jgi:hypothetical protein
MGSIYSTVGGIEANIPKSTLIDAYHGAVGLAQIFWKSANYGALSLFNQYSYLSRSPWALATGAPKAAHSNIYYLNLRYTLP